MSKFAKLGLFVLIVAVALGLGATVLRSPLADAASPFTNVLVGNTSSNPVPVVEQNVDSNGNLKVHEQGTANTHVTNTSSNPVPVAEQNVDSNGNLKVHEQGTANVNVTNSSLAVADPTPAIHGGGGDFVDAGLGNGNSDFVGSQVATALTIHMSSGVTSISFGDPSDPVAEFLGPNIGGNSDVVLSLSRPIRFNTITCLGSPGDTCAVGWVGNTTS